jgi:VanZ family protein
MRFIALAYILLIGYLSLTPRVVPSLVAGSDKLAHAAAYAVMTSLILLGISVRQPDKQTAMMAIAIANGIGVVIECVQPLTGRVFDPNDILANFIGSIVGCVSTLLLIRAIDVRLRTIDARIAGDQ